MIFGKHLIKSCLTIINTSSGAREGRSIYASGLQQYFDRCGVVHREVLVPGSNVEHALYTHLKEVDCLIVCGGDGTISSVANVLGATQNKELLEKPIVLIPAGLQNSIAHSFGITSAAHSLSSLLISRTSTVPLWEVRVSTAPSLIRYMCSYIALGAYASIVQRFHRLNNITDEYFALPILNQKFKLAALYTTLSRNMVPCRLSLTTTLIPACVQKTTDSERIKMNTLNYEPHLWLLFAGQMPLQHSAYSLIPCATYKRGTLSTAIVTPDATRLRLWHLLSREAKEGCVIDEDGVHVHPSVTSLEIYYHPDLCSRNEVNKRNLIKGIDAKHQGHITASSDAQIEESMLLMLDGEETWVLPGSTITVEKSQRTLNFLTC